MTRKLQGKNNKTNPNMILPNPNMSQTGSCPKWAKNVPCHNPIKSTKTARDRTRVEETYTRKPVPYSIQQGAAFYQGSGKGK